MRQRPRLLVPGGIYHVYARGVRRGVIFLDDIEREAYEDDLGGVAREFGWNVMSYCLMTNHVHLLIETPRPNLDRGMQRLHHTHARRFNARNQLTGHVFESRYNAPIARDESRVRSWATYIALNPVVAGLCDSAEKYRWSAHGAIAQHRVLPDWLAADRLLEFFSDQGGGARRSYLDAVATVERVDLAA